MAVEYNMIMNRASFFIFDLFYTVVKFPEENIETFNSYFYVAIFQFAPTGRVFNF